MHCPPCLCSWPPLLFDTQGSRRQVHCPPCLCSWGPSTPKVVQALWEAASPSLLLQRAKEQGVWEQATAASQHCVMALRHWRA